MKSFKADLRTAVITTKYVLETNSPILNVFHYEDGFWQFSGSEKNLVDEDYKLISLQEIIELDSSVLLISDLNCNQKAIRLNKDSDWKIFDNLE